MVIKLGEKIKAGIIGATGYAGAELFRLLSSHPFVVIAAVSSTSYEGKDLSEIYRSLSGKGDYILTNADEVIEKSDVVFAALPHGLSEELAEKCVKGKKVFIDLGADFRLLDGNVYEKWYQLSYKNAKLHQSALYCMPELNREKIKTIDIISNPGCYPTSVALGLMPAIKHKLVSLEGIIIDSKSGVTGAGRSLTQGTHFPDTNEAFGAYKAGLHRHTPEIEQTLSILAGEEVKVTFVPHLLPVNRGILSTIYCKLRSDFDTVYQTYLEAYKDEFFVRVLPKGEYANIKNVRMSNFCDISLHLDEHTGTLILTSAIDNMVKGAAGQAIQNMNIRFGFAENEGISMLPPAF
jgi:N-acetyl-gamma-glutamyl-phosphate reductase, common form